MVTYREETNIVEKFLNLLSALYFFIISFHKKFKKAGYPYFATSFPLSFLFK